MLMRAAKSRSKTEDPEQAKLKAKVRSMGGTMKHSHAHIALSIVVKIRRKKCSELKWRSCDNGMQI